MKIKITEIEANAEELKMCNTASQNINRLLASCFMPHMYVPEEETEKGEENE